MRYFVIEGIGWFSTGLFLFSILMPQRAHMHALGVITALTTGYYAYMHDATAIWVKWLIALFFHGYMFFKIRRQLVKSVQH